MKKTINIEPHELDDHDRVCGYRVKDLVAIALVLKQEGISADELRKFIGEIDAAYKVVQHELENSARESLKHFKLREEKNEI